MSLSSPLLPGAMTTAPSQTVLFAMTDPARSAWYVESGAVLCADRSGAGRARLWLATRGDVLGEAALVGERDYGATARTLCETSLRVWVRPPMREDFADGESAALLRLVMRRVRAEIDSLERRSRETTVDRVARVLLRLVSEIGAGAPPGTVLHHGLSQTELARLVGADRATVNRALATMSCRGWLTAGPGWVALRDESEMVRALDR